MKTLRLLLEIGWLCCALSASASAAELLSISFREPGSVGFAGSEIAVDVRIESRGSAVVETKFSTRLWQMSSATLVPLGEAAAWWNGRVEGGAVVNASVKIAVPEFRAATRLRLQILDADRAQVARCEVVAIPRTWLRDELAALPAPPALYDPQKLIAPAFTKLGIEFAAVRDAEGLAAFTGPVVIVVSPDGSLAESAQKIAARGRGVVLVGEVGEKLRATLAGGTFAKDTDFSESAPAQFQLMQWLREALRRKPPPTDTP